jgi:endonuclease YncB( thermonuclease family)
MALWTRFLLLQTLIALHLSLGAVAAAKEYPGFVAHVQDGDSFILREASGRESTVRMAEIDAPEHGQAFGEDAKRALKRLIGRRQVTVLANGDDAYGRLIGRVYLDDADINATMVRGGYALGKHPVSHRPRFPA